MTLNASNVRVGTTGAFYVGDTSASTPTSADSPLSDFTSLGYISTEGVTETRDRSISQIRAWQNSDLIRSVVSEATASFQLTLLETNPEVIAAYYGGEVDPVDGSIEVDPAASAGRQSFVLDVIDGEDAIRTYIPQGEILEMGDQVFVNGEAIGYEITLYAYVSTDGYSFKKFYSALEDIGGGS